MRPSSLHAVESLEPRLAMAGVVTFTDVDGDLVTVQTSQGTDALLASALTLEPAGGAGRFQLTQVRLNDPAFAGTQLSITARPGGSAGDGQVHVGMITSNLDLGLITVGGDLACFRGGDGNPSSRGVEALLVASFGRFGTMTGATSTGAIIAGELTSLRVAGDLRHSRFYVAGRAADVQIGGSIEGLRSWDGFQAESIGRITVGGSIRGGGQDISGCIASGGMIDRLVVGGSLEGGAGRSSGMVRSFGIGVAQIGGSMIGGQGDESGSIFSMGPAGITRLSVGIGSMPDDGLIGGRGNWSGSIRSEGDIGSIIVSGSVWGGEGGFSGNVNAQRIGSIFVEAVMAGGAGPSSGSIQTVGRLGALNVKSIFAGDGPLSGAVMGRSLGNIVVRRDIRGSTLQPVLITGVGALTSPGPRAIDSLSVGGSMTRALVLGGWLGTTPRNGTARIGSVTVQGDMEASSVVAGVRTRVFPSFGMYLDIPIGGQRGSQIESLVVNGTVRGSDRAAESFAVIADSIGTVRINGRSHTATREGNRPAGDNFMVRLTYTAADVPPARPGF